MDAEKSVRQGGFKPEHEEKQAERLLSREEIREEISRQRENMLCHKEKDLARLGLARIIFSSPSRLFGEIMKLRAEDEPYELKVSDDDLFCLSEIKLGKGGTLEIKFFDKLKALESLGKIPSDDGEENDLSFLDALYKAGEENEMEGQTDNGEGYI